MDQFFITPIFLQLVKEYSSNKIVYCNKFNILNFDIKPDELAL